MGKTIAHAVEEIGGRLTYLFEVLIDQHGQRKLRHPTFLRDPR